MKIVYCLAGTFNSGGMERIVIKKANWLAKNGYDVTIVTTDQNSRPDYFKLVNVRRVDLDISYSQNQSINPFIKYIKRRYKIYRHKKLLSSYLKSERADIVISTFGNEVEFLTKIKDGSKKIAEIHFSRWFRLQFNRKGIWKYIDRYLTHNDYKFLKEYDKFICLTHEDYNNWGYLPNIEVIPNFIENISLTPAQLENESLIAVGRLTYQKGYDYMIKAWRIVTHEYPKWKLSIYGDGELYNSLNRLIEQLGLLDSVKINKPISNIDEEYRKQSGLILTSHYEGLPMVILEAMSEGLPIVSFACQCGPRDIIVNGVNGFLVEEGNVNLLADKIKLLISSKDLRKKLGKNSLTQAANYLDSKIMPLWEDLFKRVLSC